LIERYNPMAVVGAGNWGTTLAQLLVDKGYAVDLWALERELVDFMATTHENPCYLPGYKLSRNIRASNSLSEVVEGHPLVVMVVPSHVYRDVAARMVPLLKTGAIVVTATKGIV
jgi:glycerol-3-phosphate dehydrogenase (NAD(P)+)